MKAAVPTRINPYPGLAPFEEQDSRFFFGRDNEVEEILERLSSRRVITVIGVSGCGKSSLVLAGVIPVLRLGAAAKLPFQWVIRTINPGNAPLQSLRNALNAPHDWPKSSFDLVNQVQKELRPGENLLLVIDQFEELFQYRNDTNPTDGGNMASLFVALLLNAIEQRDVPIYILLVMRTDFLGNCTQFRGLPEVLNDSYYLVPRMTRLQQQVVIEQPLLEQNELIEQALVQRLLNDSAEEPDQLPVLQHLLRRLWETWDARATDKPIGMSDYDLVGGWSDCLNADAEDVLAHFKAELDGIRKIFQWITERGVSEKPVRRPRPFSECLTISGLTYEQAKNIIAAFQGRGFLRVAVLSDSSLVDLSHESVMWQWSRLKLWIDEEAERAAQLRFLWQSANHKVRLSGTALKAANWWRKGGRIHSLSAKRYLSPEELKRTEEWIVKSECKERRRRFLWLAVALILLSTALLLSEVIISKRQQKSAEARELAAWAAVSIPEDPERTLSLGLHAWGKQRAMTGGLEEILHTALLQSSVRVTLSGHNDKVWSVAWSPDGRKIATASSDATIKVWNVATGREILTLHGHQGIVWAAAWSPDGTKIATAGADHSVRIWDSSNGHELLLIWHYAPILDIVWSPDGAKLATANGDNTAKTWEASTGRELTTLSGHSDSIRSIAWSPNGRTLATASSDSTVRLWDALTGREIRELPKQKTVLSIAWSPDGTKLATASEDHTAKVWDAATSRNLLSLSGHQDSVRSIMWSHDGTKLSTASNDKTIKIWDAATGDELFTLRGHQSAVVSIDWSPDDGRLASAGYDKTAKIWEAGIGRELLTLRGHTNSVWSVAWANDGHKLATSSSDQTVKIWESETGRELLTLQGHNGLVICVAWSPGGDKLATASYDKTAKIWDVKTGAELLSLHGHKDRVRGIAWSPDGTKLATVSYDKTLKVWDAGTGLELFNMNYEAPLLNLAWSPDGSRIATAGENRKIQIWDVNAKRLLRVLNGHEGFVWSVVWSPNGARLATASYDKTARVWDVETGKEVFVLGTHQDSVLNLAFSPDGNSIATASEDKTVKVWDAITGRELLTLHGHQGPVLNIAWSPDGKRLASTGADKIAQIYAIDHIQLLRLVRSRITHDLSPDACRRYLNVDNCLPLPDVH